MVLVTGLAPRYERHMRRPGSSAQRKIRQKSSQLEPLRNETFTNPQYQVCLLTLVPWAGMPMTGRFYNE